MSLCELWLEFRAARERAKVARDRDVTCAYLTAGLAARAVFGKLPKLSQILAPNGRQTNAELLAQMHVMSAKLGVPLRKATKRPR